MTKPLTDWFYHFFNLIYKKNFWLYRQLYFFYKNWMDRHEIELMKKVVKPGMIVVDVGANIGFYTLILTRLVGKNGRVYAFEPEEVNFCHLKHICAGYRNVKISRAAVGAQDGKLDLFVSNDLNVDHLAYDDGNFRRRVKVRSVTLDKFFRNKRVDFVKIDTQGFEHEVLFGMKQLVARSRRMMIMAEFSAFDLSLAGTSAREHIGLVKKMGLKTYILGKKFGFADNGDLLTKNPNRAVYYNLLYVKGNQSINF